MGIVKIATDLCKGCGYCALACPKNVLAIGKEVNRLGWQAAVVANPDDCIGCGSCAIACPDAAINVYREEAGK